MKKSLFIAALSVFLIGTGAARAELNYTIADLLLPCKEGANDARNGSVLELECEQYIAGFTDLYQVSGQAEKDKVCLPPPGNRDDEVRWAFMKWAHDNWNERKKPAVEGLLRTLKAHFTCS